jgi:hypothetical protein
MMRSPVGLLLACGLLLAAPARAAPSQMSCGFPTAAGGYSTVFEIIVDDAARQVTMSSTDDALGTFDATITDRTVAWAAAQPIPGQAMRWTLDRASGDFMAFYSAAASGVAGKCFAK